MYRVNTLNRSSTRRYKAMEFVEGSCVKGIVFHLNPYIKIDITISKSTIPWITFTTKLDGKSPTKPKIQVGGRTQGTKTLNWHVCRSKQRKQ